MGRRVGVEGLSGQEGGGRVVKWAGGWEWRGLAGRRVGVEGLNRKEGGE